MAQRALAGSLIALSLLMALPALGQTTRRARRAKAKTTQSASPAPEATPVAAPETTEPGSDTAPVETPPAAAVPLDAAEATPLTAAPDAAAAPAQEQPASEASPATEQEDASYAALQRELAQVMDDLVQARVRVAMLGKALFKTKVRVKIDNRAAESHIALRASLWLDGAPIWKGDGDALADPERALFEGFAVPGPHVLTLEIEQRAREDQAYRYALRENYHFTVQKERRTDLRLVLDDDSDMAEDFDDDDEGEYDVRTRLQVRAVELDEED